MSLVLENLACVLSSSRARVPTGPRYDVPLVLPSRWTWCELFVLSCKKFDIGLESTRVYRIGKHSKKAEGGISG